MVKRAGDALVQAAVWACGAATVAGYFSARGWLFDLASAFRPLYLAVQAVGTVYFLVRKRRLGAIVVAVLLVLNGHQIAPLYFETRSDSDSDAGNQAARLRLLQLNASFRSTETDRVVSYVLSTDPDVFAVEELTHGRATRLEKALADAYPHRFVFPVDSGAGIGIFSKIPLVDPQLAYYADPGLPSVVAGLEVGGERVTLVVSHPLSPTTAYGYSMRDRQLQAIARHRPNYAERLILVGDLNTTSWSASFSELIARTGLRDSRKGFGVQPTWPALGISNLALVPIDHVLVSDHFRVVSRRVGPPVGSDHLPVLVELELVA